MSVKSNMHGKVDEIDDAVSEDEESGEKKKKNKKQPPKGEQVPQTEDARERRLRRLCDAQVCFRDFMSMLAMVLDFVAPSLGPLTLEPCCLFESLMSTAMTTAGPSKSKLFTLSRLLILYA